MLGIEPLGPELARVVANGAWIELRRVLGFCGQGRWGAGGARSNIWRACRQGSNIFKFDCRSSILCALSEWCQRVGENLFGWGNVAFGCRDAGIKQHAKEGGWRHPSENQALVARFSQTNGRVWC